MVFSIVDYAEMEKVGRFDPEFFQPYYLQLGETFQKSTITTIGDVASPSSCVFDTESTSNFDYVEISGVDLQIGNIESVTLKSENAPSRAQILLEGGEILVSTLRPNRSCIGLVPNNLGSKVVVASSGFIPLQPLDEKHRSFLFALLKVRPITDWLERHATSSMYPAVSLADILATPIPHPTSWLLSEVHRLIEEMQQEIDKGHKSYPEAEAEMLDRLGWDKLQKAPRELFYEANWDDMKASERTDPEFFQPHYRRLRAQIVQRGGMSLLEVCGGEVGGRGVSPEYDENGEVLLINSQNLGVAGLNLVKAARVSKSFAAQPLNANANLKQGDVLTYATGAYTGRTNCYTSDEPAVAGIDVIIHRPNIRKCNPIYLALFLNSPAGIAQSKRLESGSAQPHIYARDMQDIQIFVPKNADGSPDLAWQKRLADKVLEASTAKARAREKLEEAKRLIEDAIAAPS